ncbi:WGR domain-containing protein [Anabaena azotica]|uniref:WGR domain-containing protein n=1 Tax=Anabaena azotica TaxID=197653 RepID=UPI0039A53796
MVNKITFIPDMEGEYFETNYLHDQAEADNLYLAILRKSEPVCVSSTEEISIIPPITEALLTQKVYLEFSDSKSHKFYEVVVKQTEVVINYGRIGTAGQSLTSTYPTVEKARLAASKKIHEKLKKGYVQTVKNKRDLAENKDLDISQFIRPAWKPLVKSGDDSLLSSKFGGRPWLAENESWPTCPCCGQSSSMQLFLQLNLSKLPEAVTREYGNGLIQMFECTSFDCQGMVKPAQVSYGRVAYLVSNVLIRMISPTSEAAMPPLPQVYDEYEDFFPATTILGWQEVEDYPEFEDLVALIYGWDQVGNETLKDEVVERLGFEYLDDLRDFFPTVLGCKLGGYPGWAQGMECPGCPICQEPMRQVFQLAIENDSSIPDMFGDGIGHILQCQSHKHEFVFVWAC